MKNLVIVNIKIDVSVEKKTLNIIFLIYIDISVFQEVHIENSKCKFPNKK